MNKNKILAIKVLVQLCILGSRILLSLWLKMPQQLTGTRPINGISIEFEIW